MQDTLDEQNQDEKKNDSGPDIGVEPDEEEQEQQQEEEQEQEGDEKKADPAERLKADLAKERKRRRAVESENRRLKSAKEKDEESDEKERKATERWQGVVKKQAARAALAEAGVTKEKLSRALRVLNLDDLDVDDDGEVEGLDGEVETLKEEFPELFPEQEDTSRRRTPRLENGRKQPPSKKDSSADKLTKALLGA